MIVHRKIWDSLAINTNGIDSRFNWDKIQIHQVSIRLMVELPQTLQTFLVTLLATRSISSQLVGITPSPTNQPVQQSGPTTAASIGPPPPSRPTATAPPSNGPRR